MLPGNIRYLRIEGFDWIENETPLAYDGAMRFLRDGAAIIIDLRGNGGGWSQGSKYLLSHFLDADTLYGTFRFADGRQEQQRAQDSLPAGRIKGKPLYILIDHHSRSAAEQVAYSVQQFKLGELIGATTAGASYTSDDTAIAPGFRLSVSMSEEIQPVSQTGWEVVGVKPTIEVEPTAALAVAQLRAIDRLLPGSEDTEKDQLIWARAGITAAMKPVYISRQELKAFVGSYGAASIRFADDSLWLYRPDREPSRLRVMAADGLFEAVDIETLRVQVTPRTLHVLRREPVMNQTFNR